MSGTSRAIEDVWAERLRQVEVEGFTPAHDELLNASGELAKVAALYAVYAVTTPEAFERSFFGLWPTSWRSRFWWKPRGARSNLVKAAALLVAEIDRLDRAEERKASA